MRVRGVMMSGPRAACLLPILFLSACATGSTFGKVSFSYEFEKFPYGDDPNTYRIIGRFMNRNPYEVEVKYKVRISEQLQDVRQHVGEAAD